MPVVAEPLWEYLVLAFAGDDHWIPPGEIGWRPGLAEGTRRLLRLGWERTCCFGGRDGGLAYYRRVRLYPNVAN